MNGKYRVVKLVVRLYFIAAIAVSFVHVIEASHKVGLHGWQSYTTPFAIDGIAVLGLVMRSDAFSTATRKLGFRVQLTAGLMSVVCNVYAGSTAGERIYGVMVVTLFVVSEWLSDRIHSKATEDAEMAASKRSEAAKKAAQTRRANKDAEERMVKTATKKLERQLQKL